MALDIPMPELPGDSFIKGLTSGSDLIHNLMLNKYYGQLHPSGDVANAMYVEQLRNQYGEDDPRYLQAKAAYDRGVQAQQSLMDYRDQLNTTAPYRATTTLGKTIAEGEGHGALDVTSPPKRGNNANANSGYSYDANGNNVVATPEEVASGAGGGASVGDNNPRTSQERTAYEQALAKQTGDADSRKRMRFAENLDITRNSINPDDLTAYSGPGGSLKWVADSIQSASGNPSQQFLANQKAITAASLMSKQMRQFYGDSIQPAALEKLEEMTNPSKFYRDPKVAKTIFNQLNTILDQETATYKKYGKSPITLNGLDYKDGKFVLGNGNQANSAAAQPTSSKNNNPGGSYDLSTTIPQLMQINPNYTEANIRSTAKQRGTSIDNVIMQLFKKAGQGGQ